jgi:spermidine synthase
MVPGFGSRATIWCCAALLVASGLVCRPARSAAVVLLSVIGVALVPLGPMHAPSADATVLREVESSYQFLQVVRRTPPGEPATTMLRINEGLDSFHSVLVEGSEFTGGRYYDYHAVVPYLVGDGARPAFLRILSLGAAAGTFERVFAAAHQGTVVDSVEIDPGVVALGREFFGAFVTPGRVFSGLDARVFVEHCDERYHAVLVDAYERQIYIPAHVASRQFFAAVAECLLPGGIVAVNAGGRTFDDPVVRALSGTIAAVYGAAHAFRIPESRNFMILGRKGRVLDPAVLQDVTDAGPDMGRVLAAASRSGAWRTFAPGNEALDDDRPFLDVLQERALVRRIADPAIVPIGGTRPSEEVEQEVYGLASERDWEGVLRSVSSAAAATGYLRMMAGDARWRLHDQVGAAAEYDAALAIGADDSLLPELERRVGLVLAAREQGERAERITARNGLLAIGAALVLAVLAAAVHRLGRAPSRAPRPAEVA